MAKSERKCDKRGKSSAISKLLPLLKYTVQNAVGVESHINRYFYDSTAESFDVLLGGYIDGDYFVPVRFGLKHIKGGETILYVVIDQEKIKAEVLKTTTQQYDGSTVSRSAFAYSLPQIASLVNSKDLLRYLPDGRDISEGRPKRILTPKRLSSANVYYVTLKFLLEITLTVVYN